MTKEKLIAKAKRVDRLRQSRDMTVAAACKRVGMTMQEYFGGKRAYARKGTEKPIVHPKKAQGRSYMEQFRGIYVRGVSFIAFNDNPGSDGSHDEEEVASYLSTITLAEAFNIPVKNVARAVINMRKFDEGIDA